MKKWISYVKVLAIIVLIVLGGKFLICLFSDDKYPGSPYDQQVLEEDIGFDIENGDLDSLIEVVDGFVHVWIEECELISIEVATRWNNNDISCVALTYSIEDIEDYLGFCDVICYYQEEQWVMTDMGKKYYNFFDGTDHTIIVNANKSFITVYDENRHVLKEFTRLNDGQIEYSK